MTFPHLPDHSRDAVTAAAPYTAVAASAALLLAVAVHLTRRARRPAPTSSGESRQGRRTLAEVTAGPVITAVAVLTAVLSYSGMEHAARHALGHFSFLFPAGVDGLILGASLKYVSSVRRGRTVLGWRWLAHGGIFASVLGNALAATDAPSLLIHVIPPIIWSVITELLAWEALGLHQEETGHRTARVPLALWIASPITSWHLRIHMARTNVTDLTRARRDAAVHEALRVMLRVTLPGRVSVLLPTTNGKVRRFIARQAAAGTLPARDILDALPDTPDDAAAILRMAASRILDAAPATRTTASRTRPASASDAAKTRPADAPEAHADAGTTDALDMPDVPGPDASDAREATYRAWAASRRAVEAGTPGAKQMTADEVAQRIGYRTGSGARSKVIPEWRARYDRERVTPDTGDAADEVDASAGAGTVVALHGRDNASVG